MWCRFRNCDRWLFQPSRDEARAWWMYIPKHTTGTWQDFCPLSRLSNRITLSRPPGSDGAPHKHYRRQPSLVPDLPLPCLSVLAICCLFWHSSQSKKMSSLCYYLMLL